MWSDSSDKILELFRNRNERFPRTCPCCGEKAGHMFLFKYEDSEIGGGWVWCSVCKAYSHISCRIPAWWKNMPSIALEELFSCPDNLDVMSQSIDEWVNSIFEFEASGKSEQLRNHPELLLTETIIPYIGTDTFILGMNLMKARTILKENGIPFSQWIDPHKGCTPEIPWTFISIAEKSILLTFAEGILFEITFEQNYSGGLANGIHIGTNMEEVNRIDPSLKYNDDDEVFVSRSGYWIEDDLDTNKIMSITVFLPEIEQEDFFEYKWVEKYQP